MKLVAFDRFMKHVNKETPTGCWEWTASTDSTGYGLFRVGKKLFKAHRFSLLQTRDIPRDKCVCHRCDNHSCVNPRHLFLGSRAENNRDRDRKGRHVRRCGTEAPRSKLVDQQVAEIRALKLQGVSGVNLAKRFRVHITTIYRICRWQTWKRPSGLYKGEPK